MTGMTGIMLAEVGESGMNWAIAAAAIGCGMIIIGAGFGIGWIGSKAVDAIARQPEAEGRIFTSMLLAAALIEGVTLFALSICFMVLFWLRNK
jgi:F-type H+-transporting ATPase subunit c